MAPQVFGQKDKAPGDHAVGAQEVVGGAKEAAAKVKYVKPKVLAIDLPDEDFEVIRDGGFNVRKGTFGPIYDLEPADRYLHVPYRAQLPNAEEQEIVIVDLTHPERVAYPGTDDAPIGKDTIWEKIGDGTLDPRPRAMKMFQSDLDRIYENGGIFIVFASYQVTPDYWIGSTRGGQFGVELRNNFPVSNWSFLSALDQFRITDSNGSETHPLGDPLPPITAALRVRSPLPMPS